jgi:sarcosine/dimethylglycine N-methyltransferase
MEQARIRKDDITSVTETYYDSTDADEFYFNIWGGEDIHIGLYDTTSDIREASRLTVEKMTAMIGGLSPETKVVDLGAGYGGGARYLVRRFGCQVDCVNISSVQNRRNEQLNRDQGVNDRIGVVHGSFDQVPAPDASYDVVWSQDAFLHAPDRRKCLEEALRLLKPGGHLIFTDPMQADQVQDTEALRPVYDRIHLESLGSFAFYREAARALGFQQCDVVDLTPQIGNHYGRVAEVLKTDYDAMVEKSAKAYLDKMLLGLGHWVDAADRGLLAWGILHFRKPE